MLLTTADEMRELDRRTIEAGTPGWTLMQRAGRGAAKVLLESFPRLRGKRAVIVCGKGNNGGDGFVIARELAKAGAKPDVFLVGAESDLRGDAALALRSWRRARGKVSVVREPSDLQRLRERIDGAACTVDALFGTGLRGAVAGHAADVIAALNAGGAPVLAVDMPSGLDADRGVPLGDAVRAQVTATFGLPKVGQVLHPGAEHCGRLAVVDIRLSADAIAAVAPQARLLDDGEVSPLLPRRRPAAHKGNFGHVLVLAGGRGKSGACVLAARGAARGGAGLVTAATAASQQPLVAAGLLEAMTEALPDADGALGFDERRLADLLQGKTVVVCGPGLGTGDGARATVGWLLEHWRGPLLLDADALNCLALLDSRRLSGQVVLTPHPGEMSRLTATTTAEIQGDRVGAARALARKLGCIVVLKGAGTIVAGADGRIAINSTGNPGMASGGMGDALAGLVGALLGQGLSTFDAACAGVYVHGLAADLAAAERGMVGLLAGDVIEALPRAIRLVGG